MQAPSPPRPFATLGVLLFAACLGLGIAGPAAADGDAAEPWDLPPHTLDEEALRNWAAGIPVVEDAGVHVLYRGLEYRLDGSGRVTLDYRLIYRILAATHVDAWSQVSQSWHPWHQERPRITARVVPPRGPIRWLDPENVGEFTRADGGGRIYDDTRTLAGPLPAVEVGSIVEEHHVVRDTKAYFAGGTVRRAAIPISVPVHRGRIVVDAPEGTTVHHTVHEIDPAHVLRSAGGGRQRWIVTVDDVPAWRDPEPGAPASASVRPYVGFATGDSWRGVATAYDRLVDAQLGDAAALVATEDTNRTDRMRTIDAHLAWVHERVRYTGVEFGERALVPSRPEETLERRFGDCKDKSALLVARLRSVGIDAHLALLLTGPGGDVDPELPGVGDFNHAIVHVPGDPAIWIDPTDPYSRAGALPLADQDRLALIASTETGGLVRTPGSGPADNRIEETREVVLSPRGPGRVVETTTWFGSFDGEYRAFFAEVDRPRLEEHFDRYVRAAYAADRLGALELPEPKQLDRPLRLRVEALEAEWAITRTARATVTIPTGPLLDELPPALFPEAGRGERTEPLAIERPHTKTWRYRIEAPPGYDTVELPEDVERALGPITLRETFRRDDDGVVHATFELDTGPGDLTPEQVDAFREAYVGLSEEDAVRLVFEHTGELHLARGDVGAALETFRELLRSDPDDPIHHTRIARALLSAGLGAEARRHARIAAGAAPDEAEVQRTLGLVLAHDELGRKFHEGFDRGGARDAFLAALAADPDDIETRGELAILLEHDADGVRYGRDAQLDAAIEQYEALGPSLATLGLDNNLRVALMHAGRFDELLVRTRDAVGARAETVHHVIAVAALHGAEDAIRVAARRTSSADQYRQLLVSASDLLPRVRRYALAGDLLAAGARGETQSVALLPRVDMLRRSVRHEQLDTDPSSPEGLLRAFLVDLVGSPDRPAAAIDHVHPLVRERLEAAGRDAFDETLRDVVSGLDGAGATVDVALDLALSNGEILRVGSPEDGYRLRFRLVLPDREPAELQVFVAPDGDRFRVVDVGRPTLVGYWVDRLIDAGRDETAARWLNWCLDEPRPAEPHDPLAGNLYERFWSRNGSRSRERMRVAAAMLMRDPAVAARGLAILERAWSNRRDTQRLDIDLAIATLASSVGDTRRWTRHAGNLYRAYPDSRAALMLWAGGLARLEDWSTAQRATDRWLERRPDDTEVIELASAIARNRGDRQAALDLLESTIRSGQADAAIYNSIAWYHVMDGTISETSVRWAQRSAMLDEFNEPDSLHTLATLYVETGRPAEARDVLLRLLETQPHDAPSSSDWYILGRIAETYGLVETARSSYRKVGPPQGAGPLATSTWDMAQRRLQLLDAM